VVKTGDWEKVISFGALYEGLQKAQRNVMWKDSVCGYSMNSLENTLKLREELENGTYQISQYQRFMIHEPKLREIVATRIRDRQFQRSICDNALYRDMTRTFIYDNCACLRGKGVDFALNRLETHLRRYYRKHGNDGWVLRCDIRHYFPETPHEVAKAAIRKRVKDPRCAKAAEDIIDSFGGDRGIGLGSQVSQLVELAVLDDIDHFIKERLRIKHYVRYMDDFILIHEDRKVLENAMREIISRINALGLEMNKKTQIGPLRHGIRFLKWRFILTDSGKVIRRIGRQSIVKERRKLKKLAEKIKRGEIPEDFLWLSFQSWRANAMRGHTTKVVWHMEQLYNKLKEEITNGHEGIAGRENDEGNGQGGSGSDPVREACGTAGAEDRRE
jgi:retron-type reverse transcriptase